MELTITREEASRRTGIPVGTLEKGPKRLPWLPPHIKAGRRVLYRVRDLEKWIEERARKTPVAA